MYDMVREEISDAGDLPRSASTPGWSQDDLARQAGVGRVTIADYERGKSELMRGNIALITAAFDAAGVEITPQGQGGVMLR